MIVQKKPKHKFNAELLLFSLLFTIASMNGAQDPKAHPKYSLAYALVASVSQNPLTGITDIVAGKNNTATLCNAGTQKFILRSPRRGLYDAEDFEDTVVIHKHAANLGISPKIRSFDHNSQSILMDYVEAILWPSYNYTYGRPEVYHEAIKLLKKFHTDTPVRLLRHPFITWPFTWILQHESRHHFSDRLQYKITELAKAEEKMRPWLIDNAVVCHGDFSTDNVLLESNNQTIRPWIIDFDTAALGHPFFDIAKFATGLEPYKRQNLLRTYLNREPTDQELEHLKIMNEANDIMHEVIGVENLLRRQNSQPAASSSRP